MTLVSVAMCTYNGEKYLQEQLDSIASQGLPPHELVICDDASTDSTAEIVNAFAATAEFPVRFIQNDRNLGSTKNFEKAIGLCQGELIALCDQDDVWLPQKLARLSAVLIADPTIGGVFSNAELVDDNTRPTGGKLWDTLHFSPKTHRRIQGDLCKLLLKQDLVTGATLMFRANLRSIMMPIESSWVHDGWIAWMIALQSRLVPVFEVLVKYRVHGSQQIGVGPTTLSGRLARARQTGLEQYLHSARRFEAVRERWISYPGENRQARLRDINGKVNHSYLSAGLPNNRLLRACCIARNAWAYQKYAQGLRGMAKDLLL